MRPITVSTDVFARIWASRENNESTENEILERLLAVNRKSQTAPVLTTKVQSQRGWEDSRYGVTVDYGFEIFRTYMGKDYEADAIDGRWVLRATKRSYCSLNDLSNAIGIKRENAWANWFYRDHKGHRKAVSELRDQSRITKRRTLTVDDL